MTSGTNESNSAIARRHVDGLPIIVGNRWIRLAAVHDEDWLPDRL